MIHIVDVIRAGGKTALVCVAVLLGVLVGDDGGGRVGGTRLWGMELSRYSAAPTLLFVEHGHGATNGNKIEKGTSQRGRERKWNGKEMERKSNDNKKMERK
jgi:hypothetical protein